MRVLDELDRFDAEILCIQEVQLDHYNSFLSQMLHDRGYEGWFKQKTRKEMGKAGKVDGCALFYKRDK